MKRKIGQMLQTAKHPCVRYHPFADFDVLASIPSWPKGQLDIDLKECVEEETKSLLHPITGDSVLIKGK